MIILLSPAKTIESNPPVIQIELSEPSYISEANHLVRQLKKLKRSELQALFNTNDDLTRLNYERYQLWNQNPNDWEYSPAILTFIGEVFRGLEAKSLSIDTLSYSQAHLRILSGLYGILNPLDNIRPYRLEMGIPLSNRRGDNLYQFWRKTLTQQVRKELRKQKSPIVINLASNEYSSAIDFKSLRTRVITLNFKDFKNGQYKFLTAYGKNARGKMARFILENRIEDPGDLAAFDKDGYVLNSSLSKGDDLIFTRG